MPMAEALSKAAPMLDYAVSVVGFVGLGLMVRLYRNENQKDHAALLRQVKEINGSTRANETAIAVLEKGCEERHPK